MLVLEAAALAGSGCLSAPTDGAGDPAVDAALSPDGSTSADASPVDTQLLVNGNFDEEDEGWTMSPTTFIIDAATRSLTPESPPNVAVLAETVEQESDFLTQTVRVPSWTTAMTVSFHHCFTTDETAAADNDICSVILLADETVVESFTQSNQMMSSTCEFEIEEREITEDYGGRDLVLTITGETNDAVASTCFFDSVALWAMAPP
jgi:hypothetical protein